MVDYTTKHSAEQSDGIGLYVVAIFIVGFMLFALFAGGGGTTTDPALLAAPDAVEGATGAEATTTLGE